MTGQRSTDDPETVERFRNAKATLETLESVDSVEEKLGGARDALRVTLDVPYGASVPEPVATTIYDYGLAIHTAQGRSVGVVHPEQDLGKN